mgnify:CR=1 FL=1
MAVLNVIGMLAIVDANKEIYSEELQRVLAILFGNWRIIMAANLINHRLDKHIVWDYQASNNEQFATYNKLEFWSCDGCGNQYSYQSGADYRIVTDYNSFEGNLSNYYCADKCEVYWDMG